MEVKNDCRETPLLLEASKGNAEMAKLLLDAGELLFAFCSTSKWLLEQHWKLDSLPSLVVHIGECIALHQ